MEEIKILNRGFVRLVQAMASDDLIVQAARTSYKWVKKSTDEALIDYLIRNEHSSPLEFAEFIFHVKVPIFVARQMFRHRTASISEVSARYTKVEDEYYHPQWRKQNKHNRQGSEEEVILDENLDKEYENLQKQTYDFYEKLLSRGVAREVARSCLPVAYYTQFYWKQDLRNLLHFIRLRMDYHAQYEVRVVAQAFAYFVQKYCPITYNSFMNNIINSVRFTSYEIQLLFDENTIEQMYTALEKLEGTRKQELKEKLDKIKNILNTTNINP
jgi:thymidylate synthase (FAD)